MLQMPSRAGVSAFSRIKYGLFRIQQVFHNQESVFVGGG